ncbi:hypothetical protein ACIRRA_38305 [Nocardia sp. NPDC101769]|uniref:hypothetical protein n=1 Tax=Nocardia sp. NPDC101769 TaxID=3364333 RepID=UPI003818CE09
MTEFVELIQALDATDAVEIVERLAQEKSRQSLTATIALNHQDAMLESPSLRSHYIWARQCGVDASALVRAS